MATARVSTPGAPPPRPGGAERVLILYLKTGAGHRSMATALRDYYESRPEGPVYARAEDALPDRGPAAAIAQDGYRLASTRFPSVWKGLFEISKSRLLMRVERATSTSLTRGRIERMVSLDRITRIISTHYLLTRAASLAAESVGRREGRSIPVANLITDPFTVHPFWLLDRPRPLIVPTEAARRVAIAAGCDPRGVALLPLPIGRRFGVPMAPADVARFRGSIGLGGNRPLVLVAGGGGGSPRQEEEVRVLVEAKADFDVAVVCGRGDAMRRHLESLARRTKRRRIAVFGYVDFMYELVCAADIVISKGGAASIMEFLVQGKYILIGSYLYGQEEGNVRFVVDNGFGEYHPDRVALAAAVERLVARGARDDDRAARLAALGIRNGAREVGEYVLGL